MDFKILDASAFYAGIPFGSLEDCYTTSIVYDEIKHIKKNQGALETLSETNRLKIRNPDQTSIDLAIKTSKNTGDYPQLSKQDISIIALALELNGQIISDDFAISNVAKNLNVKISPIMTNGITDTGKWVHYCPGCHTAQDRGKECTRCGTVLKRKLLKGQTTTISSNE